MMNLHINVTLIPHEQRQSRQLKSFKCGFIVSDYVCYIYVVFVWIKLATSETTQMAHTKLK